MIVAHRYGSLERDISYTEKEYDYAAAKNLPVLGFVLDDGARWPKRSTDTDPTIVAKLDSFKAKVKSKMVSIWSSIDDLYAKTAVALSKGFTAYERPGYVRGDEITNKDVLAINWPD